MKKIFIKREVATIQGGKKEWHPQPFEGPSEKIVDTRCTARNEGSPVLGMGRTDKEAIGDLAFKIAILLDIEISDE